MLEKTLESPLDRKAIKPVNPKGNQPWIFIGRTGTEDEAPILWPPDMKSWLHTGKDPEAGKQWGQEEKREAEDEMVGWHHRLWTWVWANSWRWWRTGKPGVLQSMGSQRSGTTEELNNNILKNLHMLSILFIKIFFSIYLFGRTRS